MLQYYITLNLFPPLMSPAQEIAIKLRQRCDSASLAAVVFAEAEIGLVDDRVIELVSDYAERNLEDFDGRSLAMLTYGIANTGYEDDSFYEVGSASINWMAI